MSELAPRTARLFSILRVVCGQALDTTVYDSEDEPHPIGSQMYVAWKRRLHDLKVVPAPAIYSQLPAKLRFDWGAGLKTHHCPQYGSVQEAWEALIVAGLVLDRPEWRFHGDHNDAEAHPFPPTFDALVHFAWYEPQALLKAEQLGYFAHPDEPGKTKIPCAWWVFGHHRKMAAMPPRSKQAQVRQELANLGISVHALVCRNDPPECFPTLVYCAPR